MNLSISNIAWNKEDDSEIYSFLSKNGINGLEIAPTRIFPDMPYNHKEEAQSFANEIKLKYGLTISSMQSIWYGHTERIFDNKDDRKILIDYTKEAILFAEAIQCRNLVFGNPKNRDTDNIIRDTPIAIDFFREIGDFAEEHNTIIAIEPNPTIYNTRFINTTSEAIELIERINSKGVKLNLDLGTMIYNNEDICCIYSFPNLINHIHISEPGLNIIQQRDLHKKLFLILDEIKYQNFVSVEMGNKGTLQDVKQVIEYIVKLNK